MTERETRRAPPDPWGGAPDPPDPHRPAQKAPVRGSEDPTGWGHLRAHHLQARWLRDLPSGVVVTDDVGEVVYWNRQATVLTGHLEVDALGANLLGLGLLPDREATTAMVRRAASALSWDGDIELHRRDGGTVPVHLVLQRVEDDEVDFRGFVATAVDIAERQALERRLVFQTRHDPLTGLANHHVLVEHLERTLEAGAASGYPLAVLHLDLDGFRAVNDAYTHDGGDRVLQTVAELIAVVLDPGAVVGRVSGDEFIVCCDHCQSADDALGLAGRIQRVLAAPVGAGGQVLNLTTSVGVALSSPGVHAEELLRNADFAVYRAKEHGPGSVEVFDHTLGDDLRRRRAVAAALHAALDAGQVVAWYQPVVELATGAVRGFEALARWEHPERGVVGPAEFITVAEETGLIERLGLHILDSAARALAAWRVACPSLTVAVNVSARQLGSPGFADDVEQILCRNGVDPVGITLEVTESTLTERVMATSVLERLRSLGLRIALDDFGTGYSSLNRLRCLPIDTLKLDRSFIESVVDEPGSAVIVAAVLGLATALGLGTVAEGVEEPGQVGVLRDLGCRLAQGFLWSPPRPHAIATAMVGATLSAP